MSNYVADHSVIETYIVGRSGVGAFSSLTRPTDADVDGFIDEIEATIDGVLTAQGYATIPADNARDILMLKNIVAPKVAAKVWRMMFSEKEAPEFIRRWEKDYDEFLKNLRSGQMTLVGQQPQGEDDPLFFIVRHPTRDDYFTERGTSSDWDE